MSRSRTLLFVAVVVALALGGAAWWLTSRPADEVADAPTAAASSEAARATAAAARATAEEGVADVTVSVRAKMPPDFDDGLPRREIEGDGQADFAGNVASVEYAMGEVPNSAGFFGHVAGDLSVVYEGPRFIVTFPLMADVLQGDLDWMSYQVSDFSHPKILAAGIGQLREIGLADPRLGFALASSGVGGEPDPEGGLPIDLAQAQSEIVPEVQPVLQELQALGVEQVVLLTEVDEEGFLRSYSYDLSYPPGGSGGRQARVTVNVEIGETGLQDDIDVPPDAAIQSYREYSKV